MTFLDTERETLESLLPGLDAALLDVPLLELERPRSPGLTAFRSAGGPGLLVPREYEGRGATALEAVRIQRAIGSRSPSLAVATTMHHFSVAGLIEVSRGGDGLGWLFLESTAQNGMLLASGFAEGRPGQSILTPTMRAERSEDGYIVTGSKKPCSLAHSMDVLTASVALPALSGAGTDLAIALIPAEDERIERRPFWNSPVLAGAESDEVIVAGVEVPHELIVRTETGPGDALDDIQLSGFVWFEMLMTASYLGAASALVERALHSVKGAAAERVALVSELEACMSAVERAAMAAELGEQGEAVLLRTLQIRYATQHAIERVTALAMELLGGMAFIRSPEAAYLAAAARALAFHPPARLRMSEALLDALDGRPLRVA
jgi:alkylation response protein AidB-like acyl-CoA dehydrogenase